MRSLISIFKDEPERNFMIFFRPVWINYLVFFDWTFCESFSHGEILKTSLLDWVEIRNDQFKGAFFCKKILIKFLRFLPLIKLNSSLIKFLVSSGWESPKNRSFQNNKSRTSFSLSWNPNKNLSKIVWICHFQRNLSFLKTYQVDFRKFISCVEFLEISFNGKFKGSVLE